MRCSALWLVVFAGCGASGSDGRERSDGADGGNVWDALDALLHPSPDEPPGGLEADLEDGWHCGAHSYAAHDADATTTLGAWVAGSGYGGPEPEEVEVVFPTERASLQLRIGTCLDIGGCGGMDVPCTEVIDTIYDAVSGQLNLVLTDADTVLGELTDVLLVGRDGERDLHVDHLVLPEVERGY